MPNMLLLAPSQECLDDFGRLANRLREEEHSPLVMAWRDTNAARLQIECRGKHFALVGIMGSPAEMQTGFEALRVITDRCFRTAVGICLDADGYKFYARQKYSPSNERIRCAILVGESDQFPHARAMVRTNGKRPLVQNNWSSDELDAAAAVIVEEAEIRIVTA